MVRLGGALLLAMLAVGCASRQPSASDPWLLIKNPRYGDSPRSEPEYVWIQESKVPITLRTLARESSIFASPDIVAKYGSPPRGGEISPLHLQRVSPPSIIEMPPDKAFEKLIDVLVGKNIHIAFASRDTGLISTAKTAVSNIDRSKLALALQCGFERPTGTFSYECHDFLVEYQFLLRGGGSGSSTLKVRANATAIDSRGIPAGIIGDQRVLNQLAEKMKADVSSALKE